MYQILRIAATAGLLISSVAAEAPPSPVDLPLPNPKPTEPLMAIQQPTDWFTWGFDLRSRLEFLENSVALLSGQEANQASYVRLRSRLWTELIPYTNLSLNVRLVAEPRYYFQPDALEGWTYQEGLFDLFNARIDNLLQDSLRLTVGRQDIYFGDRWLIWDGTGADGSRSEFFDAARLTLEAKEIATTFDAIGLAQFADAATWLPVINDLHRPITEQDEQAGILYVKNRSIRATQLEAFLIYRHQDKATVRGNSGNTWTSGLRVESRLARRWESFLEAAPEWGTLNGRDLQAWGLNGLLTFHAGGAWHHQFRAGYEYLSGDDPATARDEGWDPFWGRRARWSELMSLKFALENRGRAADYKNLQRPGVGWTFQPAPILQISADYMPLLANSNPLADQPGFSADGKFRGHFAQTVARFTFNRRWSGHLWGELFWPGDYYAPPRRSRSVFLRAEIYFKF